MTRYNNAKHEIERELNQASAFIDCRTERIHNDVRKVYWMLGDEPIELVSAKSRREIREVLESILKSADDISRIMGETYKPIREILHDEEDDEE